MFFKYILSVILFIFLTKYPLFANDDITIITADRIKSNSDKSSNEIKVISAKEIKNGFDQSLAQLLSKQSDLNITASGPSGQSSSLFMRGTDSSHTLVIIDGITMNDPSNPNRQFDFSTLSLNNIQQIEILKGSQGLLYGSNAIGGVIVITSKNAKNKNITGDSFIDYGSYQTLHTGLNFQKKIDDQVGFSFGTTYFNSDGFSAANKNLNSNADQDGAQQLSINMNALIDLPWQSELATYVRYVRSKTEIDKDGGSGADDPNDYKKEEEFYSKIQLNHDWETGNGQTQLAYTFSKHYRLTEELFDQQHSEISHSVNSGELKSISALSTYYINDNFTQNFNFNFDHEVDRLKNKNQNISGFLYHQYENSQAIYNFGLRLDHNQYFKDHYTYKLALGYKQENTLTKISYSTGFRSPSLNQLFDPIYGNKNLRPETSQSLELSLEKKWAMKVKTTSAFFYTKINNRLSYTPITLINTNTGNAEIFGFEKNVLINWKNKFNQTISFTILKTRDLLKNERLKRRASFTANNVFTYQNDHHQINLDFFYKGKRSDIDNLGKLVEMSPYFLTQLNYRYIINQKNEIYFKVDNLLNEDYEETSGFGTGGRTMTTGTTYYF